jgi:hypothetical protein
VGRWRRPAAAVLAAVAVILTISTFRTPSDPVAAPVLRPAAAPGEVTVPVPLAVRAVASILEPGDIVDLVSVADDGRARVVATRARVVDQPESGVGFTPTEALLLVAVPEATALSLATAAAHGAMTVIIHSSPASTTAAS